MYKIIILILSIYSTLTVAAEQPSHTLPTHPSLNQTMTKLEAIIRDIIPLTFDAHQYAKPESKVILQKELTDLLLIFKNTPEPFSKPSVSFKASYSVMLDHLEQTQKALEQKNYSKAREMLKAISTICVSSYTQDIQDTQNQKSFINLERAQFTSDFDFAEFSYLTQDYQSAITYYDKYLTSKSSHKSKANTKVALERLLAMYTQIDKDPNLAATYLTEYIPFLIEYPDLKICLQQWIVGLQNINDYFDDEIHNAHPVAFASIQNYVASFLFSNTTNNLPETDKVKFIVLRGMLFDCLNEMMPSDKEKPMLLYWLALCDRKLNEGLDTSFSDIFLKECFLKYPHHSYAALCKQMYYRNIQTALASPTAIPNHVSALN